MSRESTKRAAIERAVVEVVASRGVLAATVQDIARIAGVSPGLLYRYWENRDALAATVYREHFVRMVDELQAATADARTALDKLEAMFRAFLLFADREPLITRFILLAQHELIGQIPPEYSVRGALKKLLEAGMASGQLRHQPLDFATETVLGLGVHPVLGYFYQALPGPVTQYEGAMIDALRRFLKAE